MKNSPHPIPNGYGWNRLCMLEMVQGFPPFKALIKIQVDIQTSRKSPALFLGINTHLSSTSRISLVGSSWPCSVWRLGRSSLSPLFHYVIVVAGLQAWQLLLSVHWNGKPCITPQQMASVPYCWSCTFINMGPTMELVFCISCVALLKGQESAVANAQGPCPGYWWGLFSQVNRVGSIIA